MKYASTFLVISAFFILAITNKIYAITPTNILTQDLDVWFDANSSTTPDANYFGAYAMAAMGDRLYLGLSEDETDHDASTYPVLGYFDGTNLQFIAQLQEEDINRMRAVNGKVYVPGHDALGNWTGADMYIYNEELNSTSFVRNRYSSMQFVDSTTTDENGNYSFTGLKPTSYQIKVIKPANYVFTTQFAGIYREPDSNVNSSGIDNVCSTSSDHWGIIFDKPFTDPDFDAGLKASAGAAAGTPTAGSKDESFYTGSYGIGDRVWIDTDSDGIQDEGEPGIAGVRIELYTQDPYFPCGIHMGTTWVDPDNNDIYVDVGYNIAIERPGKSKALQGTHYISKSTDGGASWEMIYLENREDNQDVPRFHAEDIVKIGDYFWRTNEQRYTLTFELLEYTPIGQELCYTTNLANWSSDSCIDYGPLRNYPTDWLGGHAFVTPVAEKNAILGFHNKAYLFGRYDDLIYEYAPGKNYTEYKARSGSFGDILPSLTTAGMGGGSQSNNTSVAVNDDYVYALGDDNKVYMTTNMLNWAEVADFSTVGTGARIISVGYWPNKDWIIVGTAGSNSSLYAIDHSDAVAEVMGVPENSSGLTFLDVDEPETSLTEVGGFGDISVETYKGTTKLATFNATLSPECNNWSNIIGDVSSDKAFIKNVEINGCNEPVSNLYIPRPPSYTSLSLLRLCPDVTSLSQITTYCIGGITVANGSEVTIDGQIVSISVTTIGSSEFWVVSNGNDLGGYSFPALVTAMGSAGSNSNVNNSIVSYPVSYLYDYNPSENLIKESDTENDEGNGLETQSAEENNDDKKVLVFILLLCIASITGAGLFVWLRKKRHSPHS